MNTETENIGMLTTQKPQVYLKRIIFNDETPLDLNHSSIVVFTGANNSGKSQVLKDIENGLNRAYSLSTVVARTLEYEYYGDINDPFFFISHLLSFPFYKCLLISVYFRSFHCELMA